MGNTVTVPFGDNAEATARALLDAAGDGHAEQVRTGRDGFIISAELAAAAGIAAAGGGGQADAAGRAGGELYDPAGHVVSDVIAYLRTAEPAERERVLEAERAGKARRKVAEFKPDEQEGGQR